MAEFINKFKKGSTYYEIHAEESVKAQSADTAVSALTVQSAEGIGNVRKYSGVYGGKQREGLYFTNNSGEGSEAVVELNSKGNFSIESLTKHVNIESAKGVQIKPTTTIIMDSSRRIESGKGNEIQVEAKFDDFGDTAYDGYDGCDEEWAELKLNSRNLDLRCHDHGGIALQIAGKDKYGNENKIKFESDRTNSISESGNYDGEGGKGLEFGTFNNLHSSLFTKDYRFNKNGKVFAVTRGPLETNDKGKTDYPTQPDDFKDIINETTASATWQTIVTVADKYKELKDFTVESDVQALITERAAELAGGGSISLDGYATERYVQDYVSEHGGASGGGNYEAGSGIHIEDNVISVNGYANLEPLTALTNNVSALNDVKIGKKKGNFAIDVKGKYTWQCNAPKSATTFDEFNNECVKDDRVLYYENESFYTNEGKVYYKAGTDTLFADGTSAFTDDIVYAPICNLTFNVAEGGYAVHEMENDSVEFYEDPSKFIFKAKIKDAPTYSGGTYSGQTVPKNTIINGVGLSEDEIAFYDSYGPQYDEDGNEIVKATWERIALWKKTMLWTINEININLETDSKIKFDGKKIETVWSYPEIEGGDDVDHKMEEILLATESLAVDSTEVVFEKKISKNGDRSGQDTMFTYSFGNNVADTDKVANFEAFKANYDSKHKNHGKSDEELEEIYNEFLAEGESFTISAKISEIIKAAEKARSLELIVSDLTTRIKALEGEQLSQSFEIPSNGCIWFGTYIDLSGENGMRTLGEAINVNGVKLKDMNTNNESVWDSNLGSWVGDISVETFSTYNAYQIFNVSENNVSFELTGNLIDRRHSWYLEPDTYTYIPCILTKCTLGDFERTITNLLNGVLIATDNAFITYMDSYYGGNHMFGWGGNEDHSVVGKYVRILVKEGQYFSYNMMFDNE